MLEFRAVAEAGWRSIVSLETLLCEWSSAGLPRISATASASR